MKLHVSNACQLKLRRELAGAPAAYVCAVVTERQCCETHFAAFIQWSLRNLIHQKAQSKVIICTDQLDCDETQRGYFAEADVHCRPHSAQLTHDTPRGRPPEQGDVVRRLQKVDFYRHSGNSSHVHHT